MGNHINLCSRDSSIAEPCKGAVHGQMKTVDF